MKTIRCICFEQGVLRVGFNYDKDQDGTVPSYEEGLSHYELSSPEKLLEVVKHYNKVIRLNKIENGSAYTLRKAQNDFKYLAIEREITMTSKRTKVQQTRLTPELVEKVNSIYSGTYAGIRQIVEGFMSVRAYTLNEIKKVGFTTEELTAIIDRLNGTVQDAQIQCNKGAFLAGMEDSEEFDKGISNSGADPETLYAKIKSLTAAQTFFLQEEVALWWEKQEGPKGITLGDFIKSLQK